MRVLHLVNNENTPFFQQQIKALENKGVSCNILSVPGERMKEESSVEGRSLFDYLRFVPIVRQEARENYDLIHANHGLTMPAALSQKNLPVVVTFYGSDLMGRYGKFSTYLSKFCDDVIIPSEVMADHLKSEYTIIPYGIDIDLFRPIPKEKARRHLGWEKDETVVLFPYSKGRSVKNYKLAERVVNEISIDARIEIVYDADYEDMPYYMNASDALLVTSKRESGPLVIKEAALCNVPVISTDVGFASKVLKSVSNSHVCQSKRDLVDHLEDVLRRGERSNGRRNSDNWSIDAMSSHLIEIYNKNT